MANLFFVDAVFGTINVYKNFEMLKNIILFSVHRNNLMVAFVIFTTKNKVVLYKNFKS
jgi:hypothetical protein